MSISLCALKEHAILNTVMVKARDEDTWPTQREESLVQRKRLHTSKKIN